MALAVMLLAIYPQLNLWLARGGDWRGSYVIVQGDEVAYAAYINALIDGRPRRNNPHTGRDDMPDTPQPESLFSVQFVPAYAIALPARALGISASTAFIVLMFVAAVASSLAIYWLIAAVTGDDEIAAAGVLVVLCLGTLAAKQGTVFTILGFTPLYEDYLPFLRRYQPSATFPLFFVVCVCMWRALTSEQQRRAVVWAIFAGATFAVLVFSYFYLWTAAAAWLICLALAWMMGRPTEWRHGFRVFGIVAVCALAALVPYFIMLSRRAGFTDSTQLLTYTRAPDLLRMPELIGYAVFAALVFGAWRGIVDWRDHRLLFAASLALMPVIAYNQQVVTGRSLQPIHYSHFIANYVVLVSSVITIALLWRARDREGQLRELIPRRILALTALIAFGCGVIDATGSTRSTAAYARLCDDTMPAVARLTELAKSDGTYDAIRSGSGSRPVVFATILALADSIPMNAPQPVLWARHTAIFTGLAEGKKRFHLYLYYSGFSENDLAQAIASHQVDVMLQLFGFDRVFPGLSSQPKPITLEDVRAELRSYAKHVASFTREHAVSSALSYVVVPTKDDPDFTNLDRWYERDAGERVGDFTIYRVKLRP